MTEKQQANFLARIYDIRARIHSAPDDDIRDEANALASVLAELISALPTIRRT